MLAGSREVARMDLVQMTRAAAGRDAVRDMLKGTGDWHRREAVRRNVSHSMRRYCTLARLLPLVEGLVEAVLSEKIAIRPVQTTDR